MGSMNSIQSGVTNYMQKKFQIELNIKLLKVSDTSHCGEPFKIYWSRGKKKIDTRTAVVRPDTMIAKFSDKF